MAHRSISTETLWNAKAAKRTAEAALKATEAELSSWKRKLARHGIIAAGYSLLFAASLAAFRIFG